MKGCILIVDDEPRIGSLLRRSLGPEGMEVEYFSDPEVALEALKTRSYDIVLTDLRMPQITGLEVLRRAKQIRPACDVVLMTAFASVETAREALKQGAVDYIAKPFSIDEELIPLLRHILAGSEELDFDSGAEAPAPERHEPNAPAPPLDRCVGRGSAMRSILARVEKLAAADVPVLLQGESGTGKEVISSLIHQLSPRRDGPLVKINCSALPEPLLESELFGYAKGAFTGAGAARDGLFQAADGGTLLLDEIGEISPSFQPKLLRVLQNGEFHRVGDAGRTVNVDVRVIAATNRDLEAAMAAGAFRQDLYYRLNVVPLHLPPLRERLEDLPDLVAHLVRRIARGRRIRIPDPILDAFRRYAWPGNVRELANAVEHAVVLAEEDEVRLHDLPVAIQDNERKLRVRSSPKLEEEGTLEQIEMRCILQAMEKTHYNRTRAAQLLGVTRRTLGYRINKYGLDELLRRRQRSAAAASRRAAQEASTAAVSAPLG